MEHYKEMGKTTKIVVHVNQSDTLFDMKRAFALAAYKSGKFSAGCCSEMAGIPLADFLVFLGEHKICVFDSPKNDPPLDLSIKHHKTPLL